MSRTTNNQDSSNVYLCYVAYIGYKITHTMYITYYIFYRKFKSITENSEAVRLLKQNKLSPCKRVYHWKNNSCSKVTFEHWPLVQEAWTVWPLHSEECISKAHAHSIRPHKFIDLTWPVLQLGLPEN